MKVFKVLGGGSKHIFVQAAMYVYFDVRIEGRQQKHLKFKGGSSENSLSLEGTSKDVLY